MDDLIKVCQKFLDKECSIEELSQTISYLAIPINFRESVSDFEYHLEKIRFCISDDEQYEEVVKKINELLTVISD
jgi:hypothetical protein